MGKRKSGGTFIERELFESDAFFSLSGFAPQLLILFLGKRNFQKGNGKRKPMCVNKNSIRFTYAEMTKKHGIKQPRFTRAIDDLLEKGFISIEYQGGACQGDKTVYALVDKWLLWRPGMVMEKRKKDTVQRGYRQPKK